MLYVIKQKCSDLKRICESLLADRDWTQKYQRIYAASILNESRIFVGTIASVHRLTKMWEEKWGTESKSQRS